MLFACHPKILHKHCLQFLLGVEMVQWETENNTSAKFWRDKQRVSLYDMVFSGVVNSFESLRSPLNVPCWSPLTYSTHTLISCTRAEHVRVRFVSLVPRVAWRKNRAHFITGLCHRQPSNNTEVWPKTTGLKGKSFCVLFQTWIILSKLFKTILFNALLPCYLRLLTEFNICVIEKRIHFFFYIMSLCTKNHETMTWSSCLSIN